MIRLCSIPERSKFSLNILGGRAVPHSFCVYFFFLKFVVFSIIILGIAGWLNSLLLFNSSVLFRLFIRTASFACLVRGSLNFLLIFIFICISSSLWAISLCLNITLFDFFCLKSFQCSPPLILAEREVSPS